MGENASPRKSSLRQSTRSSSNSKGGPGRPSDFNKVEFIGSLRPPVREAGLLEHQLTGFQMMTFFIASSPGAGATLP